MQTRSRGGDEGFLLVGCIVAIFLVLLVLSVAAPRIGREIQRDREVEAGHRANQYVRAIQLYYKKFGHYPGIDRAAGAARTISDFCGNAMRIR